MVTQRCLVAFEFDEDENEDDYDIYQVESGARLESGDGTTYYDFENAYWSTEFRAPEEFVPPSIQAVFSVSAEEKDYFNEVTSRQDVFVGYEVTNDIYSDNVMGFIFELDLPATEAVDGAVIYQYAQYRKKFDFASDWVGIGCVTIVGEGSDGAEVYNFRSTGDLTGLEYGYETTYDYADFENEVYEGTDEQPEIYEKRWDDEVAYALEEYSAIGGNKLQRCTAQLYMPKFG